MKNAYKYSLIAVSMAVLVLSCQKNPEPKAPEENSNSVTLTCAFPAIIDENGTKVSLGVDGKTAWEADVDQIVFQGKPEHSAIIHTLTSAELANPEVASFDINLSGLTVDEGMNQDYNAAYPASLWSPYSTHMYGRSSFSETNHMLMAGYVDGSSVVLMHMTAAIVFKVAGTVGDYDSYTFEGNNGEVVGYNKLLVEVNKPNVVSYRKKYLTSAPYGSAGPLDKISGSLVSDGTTVNTIFLPVNTKRSGDGPYTYASDDENDANVVYLPDGFTIKLLKGGVIKKYITAQAPLTIRPGHMINLGELPSANLYDYVAAAHNSSITPVPADNADEDLSKVASANCYIVSGSDTGGDYDNAGKIYKFKAYKGKSSTHVGTIQSVGILWETYNTADAVTEHTVIAAADYDKQSSNDYYEIVFRMPAQAKFHRGNAVIAAYDGPYDGEGKPTGNILWSWHIWVPNDMPSTNTYGFGTHAMMSRNLGALVDAAGDASTDVDIRSLGLMYQWGRKDPFPGADSFFSSQGSHAAATYPESKHTTATGKLTIAQGISSPTQYGKGANDTDDWTTEPATSLWAGTKTIYDPCPPSYRVPTRADVTFINSGASILSENKNTTHYWFNLGTPATQFASTGFIEEGGLSNYRNIERSIIWAAETNSEGKGRCALYNNGSLSATSQCKARGGIIRCIAE